MCTVSRYPFLFQTAHTSPGGGGGGKHQLRSRRERGGGGGRRNARANSRSGERGEEDGERGEEDGERAVDSPKAAATSKHQQKKARKKVNLIYTQPPLPPPTITVYSFCGGTITV